MAKRQPKRKADRPPTPPADGAGEVPASQESENGKVTLWGQIVSEDVTHLTFAVANLGVARDLGLCGEHQFAKRQLFRRGGPIDGMFYIVVSYELAKLKAQSSQPCE